jgi:microcystin degradation protein MlrC
MKKKVGLVGLYHESNTFVPQPTTIENFKKGRYLKGQDIVNEYKNAHHEIGGMIEILQQEDMEIIPLLYAEATPGGTITAETYEALLDDLMKEVDKVLPVDAFVVAPHGAGVSEKIPDMDGHWLSRLRGKLGPGIPIVGTLDLHANVSPLMVSSTNALVSYRQNPHVDQRERGKDAARLLVRQLRKEIKLEQVLVQVPVAISIEQQLTADEPCKSLYQYAQSLSEQQGIVSLSIQLGFPYADVEEMGTSIIVVSDNNRDLALTTGEKLKNYIIEHKESFVGKKNDIHSSLLQVKESRKPALLLDMGDNIGGGSPGNNICLLEALEQQKELAYFVCIYDPAAVSDAEKHSVGERFNLSIEGIEGEENKTIGIDVTLIQICDGNFKENNPRHGGQVNYKMGKTAIVSPREGSIIMLTSLRIPPFSLQQLLSVGIDPSAFDAIVAKGVNAPIAAYAPVCPTIIQVNTPGVTQADMTMFTFNNRRKPIFPFENDIE